MKTVCFISHTPPNFLGGVSLYNKNLINYLKDNDLKITWAYFGNEDKTYSEDRISYIEIKKSKFQVKILENNFKIHKFLKQNYFDVVFTTGGPWTKFYSKPAGQKLIHIFHGTVYYFYKNYLPRMGMFKKTLFYPFLKVSKSMETPHKDVDEIICVSNKVKKQVEELYSNQNIKVIRTGVNINEFKPKDTKRSKLYGLYVGGGGYYTKGLDRAIRISKEMHRLDPNYRLIIIGPDITQVNDLINEEFVLFREHVPRDKMKYYYKLADIFLCMSRYEGGAPTLVVAEAMASGCLMVCAESAEQEIIKDNSNGLIIKDFDAKDAHRILVQQQNKNLVVNSLKTIENLSLEKWGRQFMLLLGSD